MKKEYKIIVIVIAIIVGAIVVAGLIKTFNNSSEKDNSVWTPNVAGYYDGVAIYQKYYVEEISGGGDAYSASESMEDDWQAFGNGEYDISIYIRGRISSVSLEDTPRLEGELQELIDSMYDAFGLDQDALGKNIVISLTDVCGVEWKIGVGYEKTNSMKVMEALIGEDVVVLGDASPYNISHNTIHVSDAVMWNGNVLSVTAYNDTFLNDVEDSK